MSIWLTTKCALILAFRLPFLECEGGGKRLTSVIVLYYFSGQLMKSLLQWKTSEERIAPPLGSIHSDGPALTLLGVHSEEPFACCLTSLFGTLALSFLPLLPLLQMVLITYRLVWTWPQ